MIFSHNNEARIQRMTVPDLEREDFHFDPERDIGPSGFDLIRRAIAEEEEPGNEYRYFQRAAEAHVINPTLDNFFGIDAEKKNKLIEVNSESKFKRSWSYLLQILVPEYQNPHRSQALRESIGSLEQAVQHHVIAQGATKEESAYRAQLYASYLDRSREDGWLTFTLTAANLRILGILPIDRIQEDDWTHILERYAQIKHANNPKLFLAMSYALTILAASEVQISEKGITTIFDRRHTNTTIDPPSRKHI